MNKKKIYFIADYYVDQILGGGELNNEELYRILLSKNINVIKKRSHEVTEEFLLDNRHENFIIFNFINLSEVCKETFQEFKIKYIIYEHDHKYVKSRNPATYKNFSPPDKEIVNYHFYKNALRVLCQSKFHKDILVNILNLQNVENLSGNLWSIEELEYMEKLSSNDKKDVFSVLESPIKHKNTFGAIKYCKENKIDFELVKSDNYFKFLEKLSKNKGLIFLPETPETLSRIIVEAKMLNCSIITNSLVGASKEEWFKLKGQELINFMLNKREEIKDKILKIFDNEEEQNYLENPEISILTTFKEGEKYIDNFMLNITNQTIFNNCELIIIDCNSPNNEKEIIEQYQKKHKNIKYIRLKENLKPTPCINMAIKNSKGKFLTFAMIDDVKSKTCLEELLNHIKLEGCDLVYGDTIITDEPNQNFEAFTGPEILSEHSRQEFSCENMIKCLPGPMPLWKKAIHDKIGFFDDIDQNYADDWEMWLRMVGSGSNFSKLNKIVGLYLTGGRSQVSNNLEQRKEEAKLFYKYYYIFGKNFEIYKPYFDQFLGS